MRLTAHLVQKAKRARDVKDWLDEVNVMSRMGRSKRIVTFSDAGLYQGRCNGELTHKFSLETEVYDGDLWGLGVETLPVAQQIDVFRQAALALAEFHQYRYVHRDIKPGNFLYKRLGNGIKVSLTDFGLSETYLRPENEMVHISGTRGYIDPTISLDRVTDGVACRNADICRRSDIFSLGMAFYTLLAGKKNIYKTKIASINAKALPRKGDRQGTITETRSDMTDIVRYYSAQAVRKPHDRSVSVRLESLIWEMLNPKAATRITLSEVDRRFAKLL